MSPTFCDAIALAARVHRDQEYTDGMPYVLHPIRVAMRVKPEWRVMAVLHDTLEDGDQDDRLQVIAWLSEIELMVVTALTRLKDTETYEAYIERLLMMDGMPGHIARSIKIADLQDNLEHAPKARLRKRYEKALAILSGLPSEIPHIGVFHPDDYDTFVAIVDDPKPKISMKVGKTGEQHEIDIEVSSFCPKGRIIWKDANGKSIGHQPLRFEEQEPK